MKYSAPSSNDSQDDSSDDDGGPLVISDHEEEELESEEEPEEQVHRKEEGIPTTPPLLSTNDMWAPSPGSQDMPASTIYGIPCQQFKSACPAKGASQMEGWAPQTVWG